MRQTPLTRHHLLFFCTWLVLSGSLSSANAAGVVARDDLGHRIRLSQPAQRIISLAPHLTELVWAAGAGPRLVGVDSASDYPPAVRILPRVGGLGRIDLERLLALRPDLVLVWHSGTPVARRERLRQLGFAVYVSRPRRLAGVADSIDAIAALAGTSQVGSVAAAAYRQRLAALRARYRGRRVVRVFYQVWHQPLITINGEHVISDAIALCGGVNVFAELPALAPRVTVEAVLAADPQMIVASTSNTNLDARDGEDFARWRAWPQLRVNQTDAYLHIPADHISRYTPRILDGVETLCAAMDTVRRALPPGEEIPRGRQ